MNYTSGDASKAKLSSMVEKFVGTSRITKPAVALEAQQPIEKPQCPLCTGPLPVSMVQIRLEEAAPDLLSALQGLVIEVDEMTKRAGWFGYGGLARARAAILKATQP